MNLSVQEVMKLSEEGKLFAANVLPMILEGIQETFGGSVEAQAKNWTYIIGNLKESFAMLAGDFTKGIFNILKNDLIELQNTMESLSRDGTLKEWASEVNSALISAYNTAKTVGTVLVNTAIFIKQNWDMIAPVFWGVVSSIGAMKIIGTITLLWNAYRKAVEFATIAQLSLNAAMRANLIGIIITAIGLLVTAVMYLYQAWTKNWGGIQEKTRAVANVITTTLASAAVNIQLAFVRMQSKVLQVIQNIGNALAPLYNAIGKVAPAVGNTFNGVMDAVNSKATELIGKTKELEEAQKAATKAMVGARYDLKMELDKGWVTPKDLNITDNWEVIDSAKALGKTLQDTTPKTLDFGNAMVDTGEKTKKGAKSAKEGISAFEEAMKTLRYQLDMDMLSDDQHLSELNRIKKLASTIDEVRQANVEIHRQEQEMQRKSFENSKKWIDEKKYYQQLSLEDELKAWERVLARQKYKSDEYLEAQREVYRVEKEIIEEQKKAQEDKFNHSMKWIETEKHFKRLSLEEELAAYQRVLAAHKNNAEYRLQMEKEIFRVQQELNSKKEKLADQIVDIYKETYRMQKDVAISAIDDELSALEKAHKRRIDMLSDELDQYEDIIKAKLKSMDQESSTEEFNKNLAKAQKEAQEIQSRINILSLSDDIADKAKREELEQQLADKKEQIEEIQLKRSKDLRKENLQNQLDAYKKDVEQKKQAETNKYNAEKDSLDNRKREQERYWENLINDERKWTDIRNQIMSGHLEQVRKDFDTFGLFLKNNMSSIGQSISQNLIDKIHEAQQALQSVSGVSITPNFSTPSTPNTGNNGQGTQAEKDANEARLKNDLAYRQSEIERTKQVIEARKKAGMDITLQEQYLSRISKMHDGGWVGGLKSAFSFLKNDEIPKILQTGEFVLSRAMIKDISELSKGFNPSQIGNTTNNETKTVHFNPQVHVTVNGGLSSKSDLEAFAKKITEPVLNEFQKKIKPYGFVK